MSDESFETFWTTIDRTAVIRSRDEQIDALRTALETFDKDALISFRAEYDRALAAAYDWDLWGVAYVAMGGCSDDGFRYFRDWLISRGLSIYADVLENPDQLSRYMKGVTDAEELEFEEFSSVVDEVYEVRFGTEIPIDGGLRDAAEPAGEPWEEDELNARYPRTALASPESGLTAMERLRLRAKGLFR